MGYLLAATLAGISGLTTATLTVSAEVYRCETDGEIRFSDTPCDDEAHPEELSPGSSGLQLGTPGWEPEERSQEEQEDSPEPQSSEASPCRDFTSTELRRLVVRGEVREGMHQDDVREALGRPAEQHAHPRELWIYRERERGYTVAFTRIYFEDGCVSEIMREGS